ncbi:hypothetical protein BDV96DRAFT_506104 [Lophiotrema nucula]|uniref:GPI anchored protein n=1 Tax=Lophiotrema nucula TaxID=690887 RepID=A0A6A5YK63_9PLEO|nr:hypothetical protein BDV96DRAFT_506104 [Lophiotrema nucula]
MLVKNVFLTLGLFSLGLAQDIDDNDVPQQCRAVCASIVTLTQNCDDQNNNFINCVCSTSGADTQLPLCEACVAQFDNDGHDNVSPFKNTNSYTDVNDLVRSCSFSTTTYNPSAASASLTQISGSNSIAVSTTAATTGSSDDSASTRSSLTASSGSATTSQGATQITGSAAGQSTNAAPTMCAGIGAGVGILGVALGMM